MRSNKINYQIRFFPSKTCVRLKIKLMCVNRLKREPCSCNTQVCSDWSAIGEKNKIIILWKSTEHMTSIQLCQNKKLLNSLFILIFLYFVIHRKSSPTDIVAVIVILEKKNLKVNESAKIFSFQFVSRIGEDQNYFVLSRAARSFEFSVIFSL
jgi:hypothetical protein